jgi:hypothetical protein
MASDMLTWRQWVTSGRFSLEKQIIGYMVHNGKSSVKREISSNIKYVHPKSRTALELHVQPVVRQVKVCVCTTDKRCYIDHLALTRDTIHREKLVTRDIQCCNVFKDIQCHSKKEPARSDRSRTRGKVRPEATGIDKIVGAHVHARKTLVSKAEGRDERV